MTIQDFNNKYTVDLADIELNFTKFKTLTIDDSYDGKGCFNCGDTNNHYSMQSPPWTNVSMCVKCDTISVVYCGDRMGGNYTDTVRIYKEKD